MKSILIMSAVFILLAGSALADLYKWVDENGVTHYSNTAPPPLTQVETRAETMDNTPGHEAQGLKDVLNSYQKDALEQDAPKSRKRLNKSSQKNKRKQERYAHRIKEEEEKLRVLREDLRAVERKAYTDSKRRDERIRRYKNRIRKTELDLEKAKREYKNAKYGR